MSPFKYILVCVLCVGLLVGQTYLPESVRLIDMEVQKIEQQWWRPMVNKSVTGTPLNIGGRLYERGLGLQAPAAIHFDLKDESFRMLAQLGIDIRRQKRHKKEWKEVPVSKEWNMYCWEIQADSSHFRGIAGTDRKVDFGSVYIQVFGDGEKIWESPLLTGGNKPIPLDLDLSGIRVLSVFCLPTDDGPSGDHVNLTECQILYRGFKPEIISSERAKFLTAHLPSKSTSTP